jgi:hypothetical protein
MSANPDNVNDWPSAIRLGVLELHPSHDFRYFPRGSCSRGDHALMLCARCALPPIDPHNFCYLYFWEIEDLHQTIFAHGGDIEFLALLPCPAVEKAA